MKMVVASLILALGFQVNAASKKEAAFRLLSYKEFTLLSRDDRASYLDTLRATALRSERAQNKTASVETPSPSFVWLVTLLNQAQAAAGDMCIYAGYVSQRNSQNRCVAPSGSSGSCGAGQTMCNPLLYGYGPGSGGICTASRSTPTSDCERQYQAIPNYKAYQVADQIVGKDMQSKFDAQAAQLSTYCASSNSQGQTSICKQLQSKTSYMKAKLVASEQRQKKQEADKVADVPKVAPIEKQSATATGSADAPSSSSSPSPATATAPSASTPSVEKAQSSAGGDAKASSDAAPAESKASVPMPEKRPDIAVEKKAAPAPEEAKKPEPKLSADGCIHNKDDFEARKDILPPEFRGMGSSAVHYVAKTSQVTSALELKMVNGKFKLIAAVWPPSFYAAPWLSEDSVDSICPGKTPGSIVVKKENGSLATVTTKGGNITVTTKDGGLDYSKASQASYNATLKEVRDQGAKLWINGRVSGSR